MCELLKNDAALVEWTDVLGDPPISKLICPCLWGPRDPSIDAKGSAKPSSKTTGLKSL